MAYSGKYRVKNRSKYKGDADNVVYRSLWEKCVFKFCDLSSKVKKWSSEEIIILYVYAVDNSPHRYYPDVFMETTDGVKRLIEIKPDKETRPPTGAKKTRKYLTESLVFVKNQNKWKAAKKYAHSRGWRFEVWTEKTLQAKGLMPKPPKPLKPYRPYSRKAKK